MPSRPGNPAKPAHPANPELSFRNEQWPVPAKHHTFYEFLGPEYHPDSIMAEFRQLDFKFLCFSLQKFVRDLAQDTGTVAGYIICAGGSAVVQIQQHLLGVLNNLVVFFAGNIDDRTDPAGIMFALGFVQTLIFWH
jgi:hypothetical protein